MLSLAADCAEPILLSSTHWYMPWSWAVTEKICRVEFEICSRGEDKTGEELKSQVMLGTGFPEVAQLNCTNEPEFTVWSLRPLIITGGPVKEKEKSMILF